MRAIVFLAHGSRDAAWRSCVDHIVRRTGEIDGTVRVDCAFLEWLQPDFATVVAELHARAVTDIVVVPLFLGLGKHAREDLPVLIKRAVATYPGIRFSQRPSVGEEPEVVDLLARMALYPR